MHVRERREGYTTYCLPACLPCIDDKLNTTVSTPIGKNSHLFLIGYYILSVSRECWRGRKGYSLDTIDTIIIEVDHVVARDANTKHKTFLIWFFPVVLMPLVFWRRHLWIFPLGWETTYVCVKRRPASFTYLFACCVRARKEKLSFVFRMVGFQQKSITVRHIPYPYLPLVRPLLP